MQRNPTRIWFDFLDPLSVLLLLEVEAARAEGDVWAGDEAIEWQPFELRPPPTPLVGLDDPSVADLWAEATPLATERGLELAPPQLVPWTRKAHELLLHARESAPEHEAPLRLDIARGYAIEGRDVGRVDILVEMAIARGLDRTETRAVLDVDRYEAGVAALRAEAHAADIVRTPTIEHPAGKAEGFHNRTALGTLLGT